VPCQGGVPPLKGDDLAELGDQLDEGWEVIDEHHLERTYEFDDFRGALDFTNRVGELAESVGHHPDIHLTWGQAKLVVRTHKIDGLAEADFVFAAKADNLYRPGA
jgi:4a-hydroxytetrahydrobiopterin dehydratase